MKPIPRRMLNAIVSDRATFPELSFGVVVEGRLLPVRYRKYAEAEQHLIDIVGATKIIADAKGAEAA